ncbi:MAG: hypothetical protein RL885_25035 [Planctomycetota bacterium]
MAVHKLIFEDGEIVQFNGERWWGRDAELVEMCEGLAESFKEERPGYYPDEARSRAEYVAETLGIDISPDESRPAEEDGLTIY